MGRPRTIFLSLTARSLTTHCGVALPPSRSLNQEREVLAKRKGMFERQKNSKTKEEEVEHIKWLENQMFRMHILEHRLYRHQELSLQKFEELDRQICSHPLLKDALAEQGAV